MGAKDSKPNCITYEDAIKRSMFDVYNCLHYPKLVTDLLWLQSKLYILCSHISVSDSEFKRLREAFKRLSPVNGAITKHSFVKEILGDGVPLPIADVCF